MVLQVIEMVLPVLLMLALGCVCSRAKIFDANGLAGLKSVISNICLPAVLFYAFFTASYSITVVVVFVVVFVGYALALGVGMLLRGLVKPYGRFMPLLLTGAEGGMLGYALYGVLVGNQTGYATVDLGQTVFAYTVFLAALKACDGKKLSAGAMVRNMLTNKCCIGMLLGIVGGATGLGALVLNGPVGGIVDAAFTMVKAPTSALVLLVVGYELSLKKQLLGPVFKTVLCRLAVMALLLAGTSFVIFRIVPYDKALALALMVQYALPAPFIIPLFADVGEDGEYISTTLSVHTLCTVALFAVISAYSLTL